VTTAQRSAERVVPVCADWRAEAVSWLAGLMTTWDVRPVPPRRWLAPGHPALEQPGELILFAQYDPVLQLFSLDVSADGARVHGIDDWLG